MVFHVVIHKIINGRSDWRDLGDSFPPVLIFCGAGKPDGETSMICSRRKAYFDHGGSGNRQTRILVISYLLCRVGEQVDRWTLSRVRSLPMRPTKRACIAINRPKKDTRKSEGPGNNSLSNTFKKYLRVGILHNRITSQEWLIQTRLP